LDENLPFSSDDNVEKKKGFMAFLLASKYNYGFIYLLGCLGFDGKIY